MRKYLQNQNMVLPLTLTGLTMIVLHTSYLSLFTFVFDLGFVYLDFLIDI